MRDEKRSSIGWQGSENERDQEKLLEIKWRLVQNADQSATHQLPHLLITFLNYMSQTDKSPSQTFLLSTDWYGFIWLVRSAALAPPVSTHPSALFIHPAIF